MKVKLWYFRSSIVLASTSYRLSVWMQFTLCLKKAVSLYAVRRFHFISIIKDRLTTEQHLLIEFCLKNDEPLVRTRRTCCWDFEVRSGLSESTIFRLVQKFKDSGLTHDLLRSGGHPPEQRSALSKLEPALKISKHQQKGVPHNWTWLIPPCIDRSDKGKNESRSAVRNAFLLMFGDLQRWPVHWSLVARCMLSLSLTSCLLELVQCDPRFWWAASGARKIVNWAGDLQKWATFVNFFMKVKSRNCVLMP